MQLWTLWILLLPSSIPSRDRQRIGFSGYHPFKSPANPQLRIEFSEKIEVSETRQDVVPSRTVLGHQQYFFIGDGF
jgi:hypothetical protein